MARKGRIAEIFSKAMYADDPNAYFVSYRDFDSLVELPILEFLKLSENFAVIPQSRIYKVRKGDEVLYQKVKR